MKYSNSEGININSIPVELIYVRIILIFNEVIEPNFGRLGKRKEKVVFYKRKEWGMHVAGCIHNNGNCRKVRVDFFATTSTAQIDYRSKSRTIDNKG